MNDTLELNDSQVRSWQDKGYFISDLRLGQDLLGRVGQQMNRIFMGDCQGEQPRIVTWRPGDSEQRIRQAAFTWRSDPVVRSAVLAPEIGAIAVQLTGSDSIRLLMDWMVFKPGTGPTGPETTGVAWHQDQSYWLNTHPHELLTARIPLDRETADNGCMRIIPGSHRWGLVQNLGDGFWDPGRSELPAHITHGGREVEEKICELEPGQIMYHHCLLLHKTGQNRSLAPRRSINVHLMPAHTRFVSSPDVSFLESYARDHGRTLHNGDMLEGPLFPTLFSSRARA